MNRQIVNIRLASGSILYAPLYVARDKYLLSSNEFEFHFVPISAADRIIPAGGNPLVPAMSPTTSDPTFSRVVLRRQFKVYPNDWFAVGDPVRVMRLLCHYGKKELGFRFAGTLVSRLAYWAVADETASFRPEALSNYNYVACHLQGMTGYQLAEYLFCPPGGHNPLAPSLPGQELLHLIEVTRADEKRVGHRDRNDPVQFAALTNEVNQLIAWTKKRTKLMFQEIHGLFDVLERSDFMLTAIVVRNCDSGKDQDRTDRALEQLRDGLTKSLYDLKNKPREFQRYVEVFYAKNLTFRATPQDGELPDAFGSKVLEETLCHLSGIYAAPPHFTASVEARKSTSDLLEYFCDSSLTRLGFSEGARRKHTEKVLEHFRPADWLEYGTI